MHLFSPMRRQEEPRVSQAGSEGRPACSWAASAGHTHSGQQWEGRYLLLRLLSSPPSSSFSGSMSSACVIQSK